MSPTTRDLNPRDVDKTTLGPGCAAARIARRVIGPAILTLLLLTPNPGVAQEAQTRSSTDRFAALESEATRRPHDAGAQRRLGAALLQGGDPAGALGPLRAAHALAPRDATTLYLLARAEDLSGDRESAIKTYGAVLALPANARTPAVRGRLEQLTLASIHDSLRGIRQREDQIAPTPPPANSIIVPDLDIPVASDTLQILSRALAQVFITDLSQVEGLRVLERQRIQVLQQEMQLPTRVYGPERYPPLTLPVGNTNARRYGTLLTTRRIAQGALAPIGGAGVRMSMIVFDTPQEAVEATCQPVSGRITEVMWMERQVVTQMLSQLGLPVSPEFKQRLRKPVTNNLDAFLSFGRGAQAEDLGRPEEAVRAYSEAVRLDPAFILARDRQATLSVASGELQILDQSAWALTQGAGGHEDRSDRSLEELGMGPHTASRNPTISPTSKLGLQRFVVSGRLP